METYESFSSDVQLSTSVLALQTVLGHLSARSLMIKAVNSPDNWIHLVGAVGSVSDDISLISSDSIVVLITMPFPAGKCDNLQN